MPSSNPSPNHRKRPTSFMVDLLSLEECVPAACRSALGHGALRQTTDDYTTILAPSPTAVIAIAPSRQPLKNRNHAFPACPLAFLRVIIEVKHPPSPPPTSPPRPRRAVKHPKIGFSLSLVLTG